MAKVKARGKGTQSKIEVPLRKRRGKGGTNSQRVLGLETKRMTSRNTACLIHTLTLNEVDATSTFLDELVP